MKKDLFIIAATTLIFAGCSNGDVLIENVQNEIGEEVIGFSSFANKVTRAENSTADYDWAFITYQPDFKVWGYKNTEADAVFAGTTVTAGGSSPNYTFTYSPDRYWDKAATTYHFYAAAPATNEWTFNGVTGKSDQNAGYFTTSSTLTGVNLQTTSPSTSLVNTFKNLTDVDKLIAAPCVVNKAQFGQTVQLNFIHILSKLNITLKKDANKLGSQTVTLKSFEVKNLKSTGSFDEHLYAASTTGSNNRWKDLSGSVTYSAKTDWEITTADNYIIESLVIPQNAATEVVALDGEAHAAEAAVKYTTLEDYNAAHSTETLTAEQFGALTAENQTYTGYNTATEENLSEDQFAALLETLVKSPAVPAISAVTGNSAPYFKIVYTIKQGNNTPEQFTAYYNLATVFNQITSLPFNEGWQNTLNITINPDKIEFCANVATWSTNTADPALVIQ